MSIYCEEEKQSVSDMEESRSRICDEFTTITGTDIGVAQRYLSENNWEMERALNSFFEADMEKIFDEDNSPEREGSNQAKKKKLDDNPPVVCVDLTEDEQASSSGSSTADTSQKPKDENENKLSLLTWNVDGLDTGNLPERARGLCSYIVLYTPDVVFLQELIPPYIQYLKKRAVSYSFIEGGEDDYFTGIMLKKSRVKLQRSEIVPYPNSQMLRNLLVAHVKFKGHELCLMTSHLESCKGHAAERMEQLRLVMGRIRNEPDNLTVLFGGDTNLRDTEVAKVGLPHGVCDVWERLGKQEHCRYTWDTKVNTNMKVKYVSRCRFDRLYIRPATREGVPSLVPENMNLVGQEKLDCGRYTSDHWGIYCSLSPLV